MVLYPKVEVEWVGWAYSLVCDRADLGFGMTSRWVELFRRGFPLSLDLKLLQ